MRRGLVHSVAWLLATGASVTLSWWGVHTVMAGTVYDPPRALPVAAGASASAPPLSSSTHRPEPSPSRSASASPSVKPGRSGSTPSPHRTAPPKPRTSAPDAASSGNVKSYATAGGRAVFDLGTSSATLLTATPDAGWSVQVWKQTTWIRVEFTSGADRVSVFCTWHDHAPTVEVADY
ncbi:hypothetical protein GTW43_31930 [Streptomyces sp. SID5785]|uniref:hypothetical protein n=1 Tax=Streptomyces sp. SID5785 TaxID=2690309 RepID=UPI0013613266|nr:hypothetical protein [Streptomyces sp. SID5785]MZD09656.1 hypothetical protein [Streptomyces sp. SID5785]